MSRRKTLFIDVDGVLEDFVTPFRRHVMKATGKVADHFPSPKNYYFASEWGLSDEEFRNLFCGFTEKMEYDGKNRLVKINSLFHVNVETISKEFDIAVLTARGCTPGLSPLGIFKSRQASIDLLYDVFPVTGNLIFRADKSGLLRRGDIIIEDSTETLTKAISVLPRTNIFRVIHSYNSQAASSSLSFHNVNDALHFIANNLEIYK